MNIKPRVILTLSCLRCGASIERSAWRHRQNIERGRSGPYCSKACAAAAEPRMKVIPADPERFWSKVDMTAECWEWQGARQAKGYGNVVYGGVHYRAHRLAYILIHGPLSEDAVVMHLCDNPPCVRPDHLRAGTHKENMADMVAKGRGRWNAPTALRGAADKLGEALGG